MSPAFCYDCKRFHSIKQAVDAHGSPALDSPFVAVVEEAFAMGRELDQQKRLEERGTLAKQSMYLSEAGSECLRQLVFARQNREITNPPDIFSLMNFKVGDAVQQAVAMVLSYLGGDLIQEHHVEVAHNNGIATGRSDILVDIPKEVLEKLGIDADDVDAHNLIEVKATGEVSMVNLIAKKEEGRESARRQLNLYLHASHLGLMPERRVYERGWLIYHVPLQPKGQPNTFPFEVTYSPARAIGDLEYLRHAEKIALADEDPGIPADIQQALDAKDWKAPAWPCRYCSFFPCDPRMK